MRIHVPSPRLRRESSDCRLYARRSFEKCLASHLRQRKLVLFRASRLLGKAGQLQRDPVLLLTRCQPISWRLQSHSSEVLGVRHGTQTQVAVFRARDATETGSAGLDGSERGTSSTVETLMVERRPLSRVAWTSLQSRLNLNQKTVLRVPSLCG